MPSRYPIICGPTAGGKSALALGVATELRARGHPAEIVTADAFQIYRGMDIGTAKPTAGERAQLPHHLIDLVSPAEPYTVQQWLADAEACLRGLQDRGTIPVVVGGTHLYVKALLEGLFEGPPPDPVLRQQLAGLSAAARREELERVDPAAAARIHFNDERRTIRALEVHRQTGRPISDHQRQWDAGTHRAGTLLVVLDWPTEAINRRINARVRGMMEGGLLEEVRGLHVAGVLGTQAREALGYKQLVAHLQGRLSLDDAVERIKIETRHFAKSQRTWLKRLRTTPGALVLAADDLSPEQMVERVLAAL